MCMFLECFPCIPRVSLKSAVYTVVQEHVTPSWSELSKQWVLVAL